MWKNLCPTYVLRRKNVGLLSDLEEVRHGMYREASFREEDGVGMRSSSCRQSESSTQKPKSCTKSRGFSSGMASSCLRKEYSSQSVSWLLLGISSGGRRFTFELRSSGDRAHLVLWGHWGAVACASQELLARDCYSPLHMASAWVGFLHDESERVSWRKSERIKQMSWI